MARQQYDLRLTRYGGQGWEATFYPDGIGHSVTPMIGSGWAREPWAAVQRAAWEALRRRETDVLRGPQAPRLGGPAPRGHRRRAGAAPRRRDVLPPGPPPALSRSSAAESPEQGAREPVGGDRGPGPWLLRSGVAGAGQCAPGGFRRRLRARAARRRPVLPGRLRGG